MYRPKPSGTIMPFLTSVVSYSSILLFECTADSHLLKHLQCLDEKTTSSIDRSILRHES